MKKIHLIIILLGLSIICYAQTNVSIIPPNPEAKLLDRFTFYPVSPATGIPDISIPLYEFKTYNYSIPFQLRYHSAGIKFLDDSPYPIGYGWNLSSSFRITRSLRGGKPDEKYIISPQELQNTKNTLNASNDWTPKSLEKMRYVADWGNSYLGNSIDTDYDIFTLNLPDASASFILQRESDSNQLKCVCLNNPRLKIKILNINDYIYAFEVVNDKGIKYILGAESITGSPGDNQYLEMNAGFPLGWMLNKIILPNNEQITFQYQKENIDSPYGRYYDPIRGIQQRIIHNPSGGTPAAWTYEDFCPFPIDTDNYEDLIFYSIQNWAQFLKQINFPNGKMVFDYQNKMLQKMEIYNNSKKIKNIIFSRSSEKPYLLSQLQIDEQSPYKFKYDTSNDFTNMNAVDFWGFYNNYYPNVINKDRIPKYAFECNISIGSADILSNEATKTNILTQVIYPTGGYSAFEYELNEYWQGSETNGNKAKGCGLRIKKIRLYDPITNKNITKEYKYGKNESGYGNLLIYPHESLYFYSSYSYSYIAETNYTFTIRETSSGRHSRSEYLATNLPIWYDQITEYGDEGKIVYTYEYSPNSFIPAPDIKTVYNDDVFSYCSPSPWLRIKKTFDKNDKLVREEEYTRTMIGAGMIPGLIVKPQISDGAQFGNMIGWFKNNSTFDIFLSFSGKYVSQPCFIWEYNLYTGEEKLSSQIIKSYEGDKIIQRKKTYTYNDIGLLIKESDENSVNGILEKEYSYPLSGTLFDKNMISTLLKTKTKNNGKSIGVTEIYYPSTAILPQEMRTSTTDESGMRTEISYNTYDTKNNLLQSTSLDNISTVYLWGYNNQYPIAEIKNSTYSEVNQKLGQVLIDRVSAATVPATADIQKVNELRTSLPNSFISTYTYDPLIGMSTMNNLNLLTSSYEYDSSGRLKGIKDNESKIISSYVYHYVPYPPMIPTWNVYDEYNKGASTNFTVTIEGGSGNFSYSWYIDGVLKQSGNNYNYIPNQIGTVNLICVIKDNTYNNEVTLNKKLTITYAPLNYQLNSIDKTYTQTEFSTTVSGFGGSGRFSYRWSIVNLKGTEIYGTTTNTNVLKTTIKDKGDYRIICTIKDLETNLAQEMSRFVKLIVFNLSFDSDPQAVVGTSCTYGISVFGGSGSYSYKWALSDMTGTILQTATSEKFFVNHTTSEPKSISCTVKDLVKTGEETVYKTVYPADQILKFENIFNNRDDIFSTTTARLTAKKKATINLDLYFIQAAGYSSLVVVKINNQRFEYTTDQINTIISGELQVGNNNITLELNCPDDGAKPSTSARLQFSSATPGTLFETSSILEANYY